MHGYDFHVYLNPMRATKELEAISVFKGSSLRVAIHAPSYASTVEMAVSGLPKTNCIFDSTNRVWSAFFGPASFASAGKLQYDVLGTDERNAAVKFGRGKIIVAE